MKLHNQNLLNRTGKILAGPLSRLFANALTAPLARLAEAYLCILQGKGAGTGWALDAEISAARTVIHNPSPTILDVGANLGEWSVSMQQLFPGAKIFMFEPQPACQKIISEKSISGSKLIPKAASATSGQAIKFFTNGETSGIASLHPRRDSYFSNERFATIEVDTITIDDMVADNALPSVDFMKIDVEGHELAVLTGARKSLEQGIIKALSFEFGSGNLNSRTFFHDFWDLLSPLGYKIFRILPSARLMPIPEYYEDCEYFRGVTNYIATLPVARR